jgi:hypothetical protein
MSRHTCVGRIMLARSHQMRSLSEALRVMAAGILKTMTEVATKVAADLIVSKTTPRRPEAREVAIEAATKVADLIVSKTTPRHPEAREAATEAATEVADLMISTTTPRRPEARGAATEAATKVVARVAAAVPARVALGRRQCPSGLGAIGSSARMGAAVMETARPRLRFSGK